LVGPPASSRFRSTCAPGLGEGEALLGEALLGEALLGDALLGEALLGEALLDEALLGEALLGEAPPCGEPVGRGLLVAVEA
jgi:hypothetical protein